MTSRRKPSTQGYSTALIKKNIIPAACIILRQFPSWLRVTVYWSRDAVGIKVKMTEGGWAQKFYFSRVYPTIAVNILLAAKMCHFLSDHDAEFVDTEAAWDYFTKINVSAADAHSRFNL